jgi:hypothetical protein
LESCSAAADHAGEDVAFQFGGDRWRVGYAVGDPDGIPLGEQFGALALVACFAGGDEVVLGFFPAARERAHMIDAGSRLAAVDTWT